MTERQWQACDDPRQLLAYLRGRASERKLRLVAVACCRLVWPLLADPGSRWAVEVVERFADGEATAAELASAREEARAVQAAAVGQALDAGAADPDRAARDRARACRAVSAATGASAVTAAWYASVAAADTLWYATPSGDRSAARKRQCDVLRDILGNPFRPSPLLPDPVLRWNDALVVRLARAIYEERRWSDLPLLADALLDAGCEDEELMAHCRMGGEHTRGCLALDTLLGKS
jgi:hypothetical protein